MQDAGYTPKVATHCCACGRTLKDATSVEFGIGPVCRKKYEYEDAYPVDRDTAFQITVLLTEGAIPPGLAAKVGEACLDDNSRRAANLLVHAASTEGPRAAVEAAQALRLLGYEALADRVQRRLAQVTVTEEGRFLFVHAPFDPRFIIAVRNIPGRRWDFTRKLNAVPKDQKRALWNALCACYPGALGIGPKGPFVLERRVA